MWYGMWYCLYAWQQSFIWLERSLLIKMVVWASLLPTFFIRRGAPATTSAFSYQPELTTMHQETLTIPSCQQVKTWYYHLIRNSAGLIWFRPISFNRAYSGHILTPKSENPKVKMSGATSNSRQSVWEFTELWRYCVKLPVWSCLCASGPAAAAADDGWTRLAAPTIDLLPPTFLHRNKQEISACFNFDWLAIGVPSQKRPAGAS